MQADPELLKVACTFQRVLSGHPDPGDLELCRMLDPLRELTRTLLMPGESEEEGFYRLLKQIQGTSSLTSLAFAGGKYFDARGNARSSGHARAFMDAALSVVDRSRLSPKALICGRAQVVERGWNDFTVSHAPNYGAWSLQLVCQGQLELAWGESVEVCHAGDIVVIPPQASSVHRAAEGTSYYEEFWFHFAGSSRWLQWLDWVPGLSSPVVSRGTGPDNALTELAENIFALNGTVDRLQQQLQEVMFEQLLVRQRMRQGAETVDRASDHAEVAKGFILERLFNPLSLEDIARHCRLSPSHLSEVFKAATGVSPMQWRERERLNRAGELLLNPSLKVAEVATLVGYDDYRHFTKRFKATTGLTPSDYRRGVLTG